MGNYHLLLLSLFAVTALILFPELGHFELVSSLTILRHRSNELKHYLQVIGLSHVSSKPSQGFELHDLVKDRCYNLFPGYVLKDKEHSVIQAVKSNGVEILEIVPLLLTHFVDYSHDVPYRTSLIVFHSRVHINEDRPKVVQHIVETVHQVLQKVVLSSKLSFFVIKLLTVKGKNVRALGVRS